MEFDKAVALVQRLLSVNVYVCAAVDLVVNTIIPVQLLMIALASVTLCLPHWPMVSISILLIFLPVSFMRSQDGIPYGQPCSVLVVITVITLCMQLMQLCLFDDDDEDEEEEEKDKKGKEKKK
mmetsp:Transcript_72120/g.211304  ORF Transcript_72120/g.211304 Transcript_72120/m.211304 type:complete len:123 (-) Transcript_72120:156-524(-)